MLPDFLIIGAMKAGTTSLFGYLNDHPEVYLPQEKELHFFVESRNWSRGQGWYEEQFADAPPGAVVGEASPSYTGATYYPGVPGRVAAVVPDVKLIYLVREPVERMQSMYLHQRHLGIETRPIEDAFADDEPYLNTSRYRWQIDRYLEHFDCSQLLIRTSEALRDDRSRVVRDVFEFIGADPDVVPGSLDRELHRTETKWEKNRVAAVYDRVNRSRAGQLVPVRLRQWVGARTRRRLDPSAADLDPGLVTDLRARLSPDVAALREIMEPDFDGWGIA